MFDFTRRTPAAGLVSVPAAVYSPSPLRAGRRAVVLLAMVFLATAAGCSDSSSRTVPAAYDPDSEYDPGIAAADLSMGEGNTYFPLTVGASWVFEAETDDGLEHTEIEVTNDTMEVNGVTAVVVRDTVYLDGDVIEDTWDWYAQDADGNVWYLGEETTEYDENGDAVCTCGSWEWDVDGALPGIAMLADPRVGDFYRQEYYAGEAEDLGHVVSVGETVEVEAGTFTGCIQTNDTTDLDPDVDEYKFYCPGIGVVLEVEGDDRVELTEYSGL